MALNKWHGELPLILASLFIASVIWLIAKQADLESEHVMAAVEVRNVPTCMIVEAAPLNISVNVQYPKEMSNQIIDKNFSVPIYAPDLFNTKPEEWTPPTEAHQVAYTIKPSQVKTLVNTAIQVVDVVPATIQLTARLRTQILKVIVDTTGTLPANLMFAAPPRAMPDKLLVTGSSDVLARLATAGNTVATEPINLATLKANGEVFPNVKLPEGVTLLGRQESRVTVNVALSERPVRQILHNVPVKIVTFAANLVAKPSPPAVDVVLEGPESSIKTVGEADIVFSPARDLSERPGKIYEVGLEARLKNVVGGAGPQVRIIELRPSRITIEYVPASVQPTPPAAPALKP